jgi:peptidylprolyl isomerase
MMQEGGKARLIIPPDMAYGTQGASGVIPPNATLTFEVELVSIKPGPPTAPAKVDEADYETTENNLKYYDLEVGDGPMVETGQQVTIEYTGWLTDGTMFDSSLTRGQPFVFILGIKSMIPAWNEGLAEMKVGGKRQLIIPPELAYGASGAGNVIPPNATLILEVELVSVAPGPPAEPTQVDEADYVTTASGLKYYDLTVGEGPTPQAGQQVSVQYTGWLTDGTMFDSSLAQGQPLSFVIGAQQVIPGWEEGVETMRVGGQRQLVIPADLAYGASGAGNVIPPNATLIFEVELLEAR